MPYPFTHQKARAKARKDRREENARFQAEATGLVYGPAASQEAQEGPVPPKRASWPRTGVRKGKAGKSGKRKKSPTLSKLKKLLWTATSLVVRSWSPTCIVPGCFALTQCAAHIVPSHEGAATRFFLPNLYPCCNPHNDAERHRRATWVKKHEEMFGEDLVNGLYAYSQTIFPLKKWWVLEQTARMRKLTGAS